MKTFKTYQDAIQFIGRECPDTAVITTVPEPRSCVCARERALSDCG
jgi:hypothetical protein